MITGWLLSLTLLGILATFFLINCTFILLFRDQRRSGKAWAWDYTLFVIAFGLLLIFQPVFLPWLGWSTQHASGLAMQWVGLALAAASLALHVWARRHLQQFYAERVEIQINHRLIDSGPYTYVRHPMIVSFLGLAGGLFLMNPAATTLFGVFYAYWDFGRAARQEEELLARELPGYAEYSRRVPRFLPRFGRKGHA
jgi:protein-S-isoprenylcysteine O-methyltransferase Ste14